MFLWAYQTLFLNDKNKEKIVQTSQNSIPGNFLASLIFSIYGDFFGQTNNQVANTWYFIQSAVVSHSKSALEAIFFAR